MMFAQRETLTHSKRTARGPDNHQPSDGQQIVGHAESSVYCDVTSRTATLRPEHDGLRLDRALVELFSGHSRSFLAGLIEDGHVRVDTEPARKASHRVAAGQVVTIDIPDPSPPTAEPQPIPLAILYEDDHLVVIDKPAGLVVHPAAGNRDGTLVNALLFHVRDLSGIGGELRPGIVHRLDKDTSGVLVSWRK